MPMTLKFAIALAIVALVGVVLFASFDLGARAARRVIYQPPVEVRAVTLEDLPEGGAVVTVRTRDGLDLKGIAFEGAADKPVLLQFHGNAMTAQQAASWFAPLIAEGYGLIFAEYRGYSGNPGSPSEAGTALDAAAWSDFAFARASQTMSARKVFYIGHSLGGGVAFQAARHKAPAALVTIGTFADTPRLAPTGSAALIADRYDNRAEIARLHSPYYILHGSADPVIAPAHAALLFDAAQAAHIRGARFVLAGDGHNPGIGKITEIIAFIAADGQGAATLPDSMQGVEITRFSEGK